MTEPDDDKLLENALVNLALSAYIGERCKYCGKVYETLDDLKDVFWAGYQQHGCLACKTCWLSNNPG